MFHTNTGTPVAVGDTVEFDYYSEVISNGVARVRMIVDSLSPFCSTILEEDLEKTGQPYRNRGYSTEWNLSQFLGIHSEYLTSGTEVGDKVYINGAFIPIDETVIDYRGIRIARSAAVELTIEGETKYAMSTDTIEIDGEVYLKSACFRVVENYSDRRRGGEWVAEEPEDGYVYSEDFDCWASEDLVCYCYGSGELCWYDEAEEWDGELYSNDWLIDNTFVCGCCGYRNHNDDYAEGDECSDCWSPPSGLQSYSDKSSAKFRPEKNVPLKFGIELEVESDDANDGVALCESIFPDQYVVYKEDGSLSCEGFEIVTRPDAPEVHKRIFSEFLGNPNVRRSLTSWNSGNCGVHIHVSRAPLSALWIGRIIVMINSPAMKSIVGKVSGRYNTSYAGINNCKGLTHGKKNKDERKYDAVNNSPRDTIEFRLFRGTLVKESFLRYIEFVESVLAFTSPATTSNRDVSEPQKYLDFVSKRRKDYKILFEFLKLKGFAVSGPVIKPKPEHIK